MQELRLVFIIVGGLAIAGLLVHGILKSKKETKSKFADIPASKIEPELSDSIKDEDGVTPQSQVKLKASDRIEPDFGSSSSIEDTDVKQSDPLFGSSDLPFSNKPHVQDENDIVQEPIVNSENSQRHQFQSNEPNNQLVTATEQGDKVNPERLDSDTSKTNNADKKVEEKAEDNMDVIVFHVHAAGDMELNGADLFLSMKQNGLLYGAMDIFHRHTDTSGTGKVLFSVANMMKPGSLAHDDPQTFNTKGISFFMTLPCFGEPEQNFKLMLRTAQQIADDLGANVLDDKRHLMTPDRIAAYRKQVRDFVAQQKEQQ